jgi:hypothetical protein
MGLFSKDLKKAFSLRVENETIDDADPPRELPVCLG